MQKISGKLVADVRPILTRRGVHIIHTTTTTIPCDHLRPSTLCLSKDNTLIEDQHSYRPITDKVINFNRLLFSALGLGLFAGTKFSKFRK